ncbi:MAG: aminotransferase class IV [Maribacter sp.]|nr:aminotransferase class IV [Maribacter sp.]
MVNFNGDIRTDDQRFLDHENRGLRYGDALFEQLRVAQGEICFWEEHYLRLMASMRILRMDIPMKFTMEYLENEILKTVANCTEGDPKNATHVRFTVFRNNGGEYLPVANEVSFIIEADRLPASFYVFDESPYEVELFKDYYANAGLLATLTTNNRILNVLGSIFAKENGYDDCLLLNTNKQVVEALDGNLFMVNGTTITTPPILDGCLNGTLRHQVIAIIDKLEDLILKEASISPFDLQKADELFITNVTVGIRPITHYRKKHFESTVAKSLLGKLNAVARFQKN